MVQGFPSLVHRFGDTADKVGMRLALYEVTHIKAGNEKIKIGDGWQWHGGGSHG